MKRTTVSERSLVLAPHGRDAAIAAAMLDEAGLETSPCISLDALIQELDRGAACVVVTEEAIATADLRSMSAWLADQEEWSDLPFVLLTRRGGGLERNPAAARHLEVLGNVTFLERPFHPTTLVSLVRSALRGRKRQYEARARLIALRESEQRYRTLFESMDEGFAVIEFFDGPHGEMSDYIHVQANPAYERHAGIPNVVGQKLREMVPDEADDWVRFYRKVLLTGEPVHFEQELVATGRHLELSAFRVEPASRREVAVLFQDVTERRRAELALRASEARYRALFESIESGFCIIEVGKNPADGRTDLCIVEANPAFERQSGLVGAQGKWLRAFTPELEEHWYEIYERIVQTGTPERFEENSPALGRWFDVYAVRIDYPEKLRVAVLFHDISERREAEERLRRLNETLEGQVAERTAELDRTWRLSQDLFGIADARGFFFRTNPAWQRVLGWTSEEIAATPFMDLIHPDDHASTRAVLADLEAGRPAILFENRYRGKDGAYRWLSWSATAEAGEYYCVARNVTAEKAQAAELDAAQGALRQSQKMEAMGQLTGGVAHDFNNLLTPIVGSLDLLKRRGLGGEREQRLIEGAVQSADRAKLLVQRLLAFARRQPLQSVSVDIGGLIAGMADLVASTTGPKISVEVQTPDNLPPARVDPNQLEMALLNLAVNARDAMPDGGTLTISARAENVRKGKDDLEPGRYVCLVVGDTGIGMDEETLARAVEPFYSTKGVGKGTGLGLSMVHGLASQLGGALRIASEIGRGTTIELWLPETDAAPVADDMAARAPDTKIGRGTVLLVDDETFVRQSTADMLADLGYKVIEAKTAEEALRLFQDGVEPDLIVTDHLMPGMSGEELAREIRVNRPSLPILLVSGYAENVGVDANLPRLTKPFRADELAASLAAL